MNKLLLCVLVWSLTPVTRGEVGWFQPLDPNANAYINQEFSDYPDYSTYQVHDVVVPPFGWAFDAIYTWYINGATPGNWTTVTQGRFNVFPKSGGLPGSGYDPSSGTVVPVTITNPTSGVCELQTIVGVFLAPGQYWIGVTPITTYAVHGQKYHCQTTNIVGAQSALRNPGGSFGFGTYWTTGAVFCPPATADSAIRIDCPEPTALLLLGLMALLRQR